MELIYTCVGMQWNLQKINQMLVLNSNNRTSMYIFIFSSTRIDPWDIGQHLKVALKGPAESAKLFQEWLHELSPVIAHFWVGNAALPEARLTILHKIPPNEWQAIRKTILMYFSPPDLWFLLSTERFLSCNDVKAEILLQNDNWKITLRRYWISYLVIN